MKYFGIKTPKTASHSSYIWWISDSEHNSWMSFFNYPNKDKELNSHRLPLAEAIKAYKAIGYRCVELEVVEKDETNIV